MANLTLDGDELNVNDNVYDVVYGDGTVKEAYASYVVVKFVDREVTYNGNGNCTVFDKKTLFWHNPVLITPRKSYLGMDVAASAAEAVINQMSGI